MCRLFGDHDQSETFASNGFNDWKNSGRAIKNHEHSKNHQTNYITFKRRARELENLEDIFENSVEIEMEYWRQVLHRIVSVIKFLGSRALPFQGANQ